jgi:hypothetical protein
VILILMPWASLMAQGRLTYNEQLNELNQKRANITAKESEIARLMVLRRQVKDPLKIRNILEALVENYDSLQGTISEYEAERARAHLRFPLQQDKTDIKFPKYFKKTLKQMMREDGLPEKLEEAKILMELQYGKPTEEVNISKKAKGNISDDLKLEQRQKRANSKESNVEDLMQRPIIER